MEGAGTGGLCLLELELQWLPELLFRSGTVVVVSEAPILKLFEL